jgi:hypothetical protein
MTNTEKMLRDALLKCQAQLSKHRATLSSPEVDEAIGIASDALTAQLTPTPVFYVSGSYVRGPARPEGSGFKEVVFKLPSPRSAEMTADSLNSMFAAHCAHPHTQAKS